MSELEDNIINLGEYFTDRAAQMLKTVLTEQNKNISALSKAVGKLDNNQKSVQKKQEVTLSKEVKKIQDENRKLMAQNRNESLKLSIMAKDIKKQELAIKKSSLVANQMLKDSKIDRLKEQQQRKLLKELDRYAFTPAQLERADKIREQERQKRQAKSLEGLVAYTPEQLDRLDYLNKQIQQSKLDRINKQIYSSKYNKFLSENNTFGNNLGLLSKGAIPVAWKPQDKFQTMQIDLLGDILNTTKGAYVLDKKQQKVWDKFMKGFTGSVANFATTIFSKAAPTLTDLLKMKIYQGLYGYVGGAKDAKDYKNRSGLAKTGMFLTNMLLDPGTLMSGAGVLGSLWVSKKVVSSLSGKGGGTAAAEEVSTAAAEEVSNIGKFAKFGKFFDLFAKFLIPLEAVWHGGTGFSRGFKEGGFKEGLARGLVNIPTGIAKSTLSLIPGLGKFTESITDKGIEDTIKNLGKLISLSVQLGIVNLKSYFNEVFKKIFPSGFDLFQILKKAFIDAWNFIKGFGKGTVKFFGQNFDKISDDTKKAMSVPKKFVDQVIEKITPGKSANLKNTMEVIDLFKKKIGHNAYISSITGGIHSPFSGHYQGKKFDVGLLNKSEQERIKQYKALTSLGGVKSIGFETPDKKKYEMFKKELNKEGIDTSKLKSYYWTKQSSGEHFDVTTQIAEKEKVAKAENTPTITKQSKPPTRSINSSGNYDPTKNKETMTAVLNSYSK